MLKVQAGLQVYPFIGVRKSQALLTAHEFFDMVGMHPEIARVASVEEIVGVKAVKAKCVPRTHSVCHD